MPLTLEAKRALVEDVHGVASTAHSVIAAEYRGLTVAEMTDFRVRAKQAGVLVRVVRNTLARRAFEGTDYACMNDAMTGPLVLAFSQEEPGAAARVVKDFAKGNDKLVVRLVSFDGQLMDAGAVDRLASLPTREEALSMLMAVIMAPASKLVRTLAEPRARLVRTLDAVRAKRESESA